MTHVRSKLRAGWIVFLLLMIVVVPAPLVAQVQSPATCLAEIASITVTPFYADPGDNVTVTVVVNDVNPAPDGPGKKVRVEVTATYADGQNEITNFPDEPTFNTNGQAVATVSFPVNATTTARWGQGNITVRLPDMQGDVYCQAPTDTAGSTAGPAKQKHWGFWVAKKPDLRIQSVQLLKHEAGDENLGHATPLTEPMNFTRYPSITDPNQCFENATQPDLPSIAHFRFTISNHGNASFGFIDKGTGSPVGLPLRVLFRDGSEHLNNATFQGVFLGPGDVQPTTHVATMDTFNYNLTFRAGERDIRIVVDSAAQYPEGNASNEANNEFRTMNSTSRILFKAPDLIGSFNASAPPTIQANTGKITGRFLITNNGTERAGRPPAAGDATDPRGTLCFSKNGGPIEAAVYLDVPGSPEHLIERYTIPSLTPNATFNSATFTTPNRVGAGIHTVYLVLDPNNNVTELNETRDGQAVNVIASQPINVTDLAKPALGGLAVNGGQNFTGRVRNAVNISGNVTDDADFSAHPPPSLFPQGCLQATAAPCVVLDITHPGAANATRTVVNHTGLHSGYVKIGENATGAPIVRWWFNFSNTVQFTEPGEYQVVVRAIDSLGHSFPANHTDVANLTFRLSEFDNLVEIAQVELCPAVIAPAGDPQPAPACAVVLQSQDPASNLATQRPRIEFAPFTKLNITFRVPPGSTGLEINSSARKSVAIYRPTDTGQELVANISVTSTCWNNVSTATTGGVKRGPVACAGAPVNECLETTAVCFGFFNATFDPLVNSTHLGPIVDPVSCTPTVPEPRKVNLTRPGPYNLTFWVGDSNCQFTAWNITQPPHLFGVATPVTGAPLKCACSVVELWDTQKANATLLAPENQATASAGSRVTVRANLTDNHRVTQAVVEVFAPGSPSPRIAAVPMRPASLWNATNQSGVWEADLETGFDKAMDLHGSYPWRVQVRDANHTWNATANRSLSVLDRTNPVVRNDTALLAGGGNPQEAFEPGERFFLRADITDDTRFNATAIVRNGSREVARLALARDNATDAWRTPDITANATTTSVSDPQALTLAIGEYTFAIEARDSAGKANSPLIQRAFRVVANAAPSFLNLSVEQGGFAKANATLSLEVQDLAQGIKESSIAVRSGVDAATATTPITPTKTLLAGNTTAPQRFRLSFPLPAEALHGAKVLIQVTAEDLTGLAGTLAWNFTVDRTAPITTLTCQPAHPEGCAFEGRVVAVRGDTRFNLTASDPDPANKAKSGVRSLEYTVEAGGRVLASSGEILGDFASFRAGDQVTQDGTFSVAFEAVDGAGNREGRRVAIFTLDTKGPSVQGTTLVPVENGWNVTTSAVDTHSSVRSLTLFYRTGVTGFEARKMSGPHSGTLWSASLPGASRGVQVCYYVEAVDNLGNLAFNGTQQAPNCFSSENHPPSLSILNPQEGEEAGAALTVRWAVSDLDGDPVTVSMAYRRSTDVQLVSVPVSPEQQGQRSVTIDTSSLARGSYVLRVDASDNQVTNNRTSRTVNFTVGGGDPTTGRPTVPKDPIQPGETFTVRVTTPRAADGVDAVVLRDGRRVATVPMEQNPPGSNTWEAALSVAEPGVYEVEVRGTYSDGTPFTIKAASAVTVRGGLLGLAGLESIAILAVAVLVVALAVVGLRRGGS